MLGIRSGHLCKLHNSEGRILAVPVPCQVHYGESDREGIGLMCKVTTGSCKLSTHSLLQQYGHGLMIAIII